MKYVTWAVMGIVSLMMLMGGVMKLSGNPMATAVIVRAVDSILPRQHQKTAAGNSAVCLSVCMAVCLNQN